MSPPLALAETPTDARPRLTREQRTAAALGLAIAAAIAAGQPPAPKRATPDPEHRGRAPQEA
jgi:hypothetical protein